MAITGPRTAHGPRSAGQLIHIGYDGTASTGSVVVIPVASMMRPQERIFVFTAYSAGAVKIEYTSDDLNIDCVRTEQPPLVQYHWRQVAANLTVDTPFKETSGQLPTAVRLTFTGTSPISLTMNTTPS